MSGIWIKASWCGPNLDKLEMLASTGKHLEEYPNATSAPYCAPSQIIADVETLLGFPLVQD